ncbi:MAG: alpha/beta hydrolase [Thiobacillaceae bacterium]
MTTAPQAPVGLRPAGGERVLIARDDGGLIETLVETPGAPARGLALIAHPHPLHGGSLDNKVTAMLARAALACGLIAVRPNFRGVGASTGTFDQGIGETEDLLSVAREIGRRHPGLPWSLMGFSFGAYVQYRLASRIEAERLILVAPAVTIYSFGPPPAPSAIIHGEADELIPLVPVEAYARRYDIPLIILPAAGHFFHGQLIALRETVRSLLCPPSSSRV